MSIFEGIDLTSVTELLKNGDISGWYKNNEGGNALRFFQSTFAEYVGTRYAFATASGSSAIYVALKACGIKRGDAVIVPSFTHVGTVAPIILAGARPVFVDVDDFGNLSPEGLEYSYATNHATALIAVHMLGMPCNMVEIRKRFDGIIIEDASHALGSEYRGGKCGALGDIGCFSIGGGRTKSICCGEGGMITTNSTHLAEKCKNIRNHGDRVTDVDYACFNFRMSELNAMVGVLQMPKLLERNNWQTRNAERIISELPECFYVPKTPSYAKTVHYLIGTIFNHPKISRNEFLNRLVKKGWDGGQPRMNIGGAWGKLISDIKFYQRFAKVSCLPNSVKLRDNGVWIDYHRYPRTADEISLMLNRIKMVLGDE